MVGGGWWWWCLNVKLVIGFGPSLGLGLELRTKLINIFFIGSYKFVSYVNTQSSATKLLNMFCF